MSFLRAFAVAGQAWVELLYDADDGPALRALGSFAVAVQDSPLILRAAAVFRDLWARRDSIQLEDGNPVVWAQSHLDARVLDVPSPVSWSGSE